jgi:hypothetical protein
MDFTNIHLLTTLNNNIDIDKTDIKQNITYIHFYKEQQINLPFNSHFIHFNNKTFYQDYFCHEGIINTLKNPNSNDIVNFTNILNNTNYQEIYIEKAIIFYINTLSAGHEFASIMHSIYNIYTNKLFEFEIVISDNIFQLGNFLVSILYLFFDKQKIIFVNNNTKVFIKETYIHNCPSEKKLPSIELLLDKLKITNIISNNNKFKNICLIKTISDKKINSPNKSFSNDYNLFFKSKGFEIIFPEELDVKELYNIISNCENIVMSWGANSWCNSTFVNYKQNVISLCHVGYANEYEGLKIIEDIKNVYTNWTPICNKNIMVYDLKTELTDETKCLLENTINKLFE